MSRVREARLDDAVPLVRLLGELGYPGSDAFIDRRLRQQLGHADACLLVAEGEDGQLLGFISLHFIVQLALDRDFCRISYLCVDATARGQGIGERLVRAAEQYARARGCDRLELHCDERRTAAHRFYTRLGYQEAPKYFRRSLD
ncbi:GNAT family N-acetyltransferase [Stutzerimonas stutzeri]|uniref:GNAT family N-acetyltransferase n=1 Tax=Stutzerimonas TaxID=2901164 RepID=UPI001BAEC065|nr:GNAT family N-acetyltransferase [Stutzerimonas stutzeri]MCI0915737.1 GNAT family N-acetyltransferase [Stutzerimonas stutzeri]QUE77145.1 GNAT family N-acetyltransferase [Stutzerimonas stutzeri]